MQKLKTAVLISGSGTNLQALIDACGNSDFPAQIVLVLSNKADAYGLERAKKAGIKTAVVNHKDFASREEFDRQMDKVIIESGAKFICMAGFMRLLSGWFTQKWQGKLVNIHPSLLPSFKGVNAQKQALEYGVKIAGCTTHFVTEEMDAGPIIAQAAVKVDENETVESLTAKILEKEHEIYPKTLRLVAEGKASF
ncbi:MAG: phosphoribosylglycinamide formyltransferase [Rickettsiales bacterium]|nr:phosphoribosylglycinamide formyltransferase [Pseudomonadota bacterium]MDA0965841.1 phosphoribosylglycinamide formyltransferase [Pseudomonadota bacterium]MDG4542689.1 phosphoribosylglycinamide formyltransferase [Rickettsiales bacterium]MDG4545193.1 phosphoribosylglycinamide formyltransferase [Rickettsiales bacterium]MDG4547316.1 phosphoribosylglycinamide formyltransferase [Rickettsiales bacterium]